VKSTFEIEAT